jgi:hypothetical protein
MSILVKVVSESIAQRGERNEENRCPSCGDPVRVRIKLRSANPSFNAKSPAHRYPYAHPGNNAHETANVYTVPH